MNNINKNIISAALNPIPCDVVFDKVLIDFNIGTMVSYVCTTKACYAEFIKNVKGLWARTAEFSKHELAHNPVLPLFRLVDGLQRYISMIAIFKKYKWLFEDKYTPFGDSSRIKGWIMVWQSLSMQPIHRQIGWARVEGEMNRVEFEMKDVSSFTGQIFNGALAVFHFLAGVEDVLFWPSIPCILFALLAGTLDVDMNLSSGFLPSSMFMLGCICWLKLVDKINDMYIFYKLAHSMKKDFINPKMLDSSWRVGFWIGILVGLFILWESTFYLHKISFKS